ncbi:unnamed protein product [Blumeria hordei]|uniref:Uncharacterized protein n=1 Tax=Blumeria hordei TaxID=2867405 RepID=A0A383UQB0_BLUHO|nr:unnamed protein product [Blumeria hordei]
MRIRRLCAWEERTARPRWIRKHKFGFWKQTTQPTMKMRFWDEHEWR